VIGTQPGVERRSPYVFVVGCPRSGTTLLQRMLDHHPMLAVANDTHFIPKVLEDSGDVQLSPELVDRVLGYHRFPRLGLPEDAVLRAAAHSETYATFVSTLYAEFGARHGKPLGGEKTPDYVRCLPLLDRLFPWARVVHIVRDGRDVALSALQWARPDKGPGRFALWQEDPVAVCAMWWRWQVGMGRSDGRHLGSRYRELHYEDLVTSPRWLMQALCDFLGLPFAPETVAFHVGRTRQEAGLSAKGAWLPPTPGLRDWRHEMPERDVAMFEALAGDLLSALGYAHGAGVPSRRLAQQAEQYRRRWELELAHRRAKRRAGIRA
jgi:hypothetical protein